MTELFKKILLNGCDVSPQTGHSYWMTGVLFAGLQYWIFPLTKTCFSWPVYMTMEYGATNTHTHPFNGPLSRTTWTNKGTRKKGTSLDFTEARDSGISWAMCKPAPCSRQGNHKNAILVQKTTPEINKAHQPIRPKWPETNNLSAKPSFVIISNYKKLSYCRGTARCVVSIEILPTATQQCRNYLYDKSWPNRWYEVGDLVGGNAW